MGEYSKFISEKRRSVPTPKSIADERGRCVFGTFESEFEELDLVRLKRPTRAPQAFNKLKLTLWEAVEVNLPDGMFLAACCDMGLIGKCVHLFFDKRTRKVYNFDATLKPRVAAVAGNLLGGSVTRAVFADGEIEFVNTFEAGVCRVSGRHKNGNGDVIEYGFELSRVSRPSVVSIPFPHSNNRPLYSQKDLFEANGHIVVNGRRMDTDGQCTAVVDDHKGFYPRRAHYDWVTTMGKLDIDGESRFFGLNLTRNQSVDQRDYNENLIWLEGATSLLPPVTFEREPKCNKFDGSATWRVTDEYDMVNVALNVVGINPMVIHALVVSIDYYVAFGTMSGYVRDENGKKYILDGMAGMGEDKTLLL